MNNPYHKGGQIMTPINCKHQHTTTCINLHDCHRCHHQHYPHILQEEIEEATT